jgi:tetratricopeptide (TPR) repeat protein
MVAYFRYEHQTSIDELEQAVSLLPKSVTAHAVLAIAYDNDGLFEKSRRISDEMNNLTPASAEDYLFKGYATNVFEPGQGLADLNEGISQRDSPLGRAMRAQVRTTRAMDTGKMQEALNALTDANAALLMLPENAWVLSASTYARMVAAGIFEEARLFDKSVELRKEAARDVAARPPLTHDSSWTVFDFYYQYGEKQKALDSRRRHLEKTGNSGSAFLCAVVLYEQGKFDEAIHCLKMRRNSDLLGDVTQAFVKAEVHEADAVYKDYRDIVERYPHGRDRRWAAYILLLLGSKKEAEEFFQEVRPQAGLSASGKQFADGWIQFGRGQLDEARLLELAGNSRINQIGAHFDIAMSRLATGNVSAARDHFQKAIQTRAWWCLEHYFWSQMFLSRMKADPNWPLWLTSKKNKSAP